MENRDWRLERAVGFAGGKDGASDAGRSFFRYQ